MRSLLEIVEFDEEEYRREQERLAALPRDKLTIYPYEVLKVGSERNPEGVGIHAAEGRGPRTKAVSPLG